MYSRLSALLPLELWSLKKVEAKAAIAKSDFLTHQAVTSSPLLRSGPPTAACPCSKSILFRIPGNRRNGREHCRTACTCCGCSPWDGPSLTLSNPCSRSLLFPLLEWQTQRGDAAGPSQAQAAEPPPPELDKENTDHGLQDGHNREGGRGKRHTGRATTRVRASHSSS